MSSSFKIVLASVMPTKPKIKQTNQGNQYKNWCVPLSGQSITTMRNNF